MNDDLKIKKRKCRVIQISEDELAMILSVYKPAENFEITLPRFEGLPDDFVIMRVDFDMSRLCFRLLVFHDSFEPVPAGGLFPIIDMTFSRVKVKQI